MLRPAGWKTPAAAGRPLDLVAALGAAQVRDVPAGDLPAAARQGVPRRPAGRLGVGLRQERRAGSGRASSIPGPRSRCASWRTAPARSARNISRRRSGGRWRCGGTCSSSMRETDAYRLINSDGDGLSGLDDRPLRRRPVLRGATASASRSACRVGCRSCTSWRARKFARVHVDHDFGSLEGIRPSTFNETNAAAPRSGQDPGERGALRGRF